MSEESLGIFNLEIDAFDQNDSLELENVQDDLVLREISENFFDTEEYGDFEVAGRNFRSVNPDDFLKENENRNTKRKTDSDMRLFLSFLMSKNEVRKPEFIPPDILNTLLSEFILGVTKRDGTEYEPSTLRGFVGSIDRHLKSCGSKMSIFKDIDFVKSRMILSKKMQQLKAMGLGNKPREAQVLDDYMLDKMYEANTLGKNNPRALLHSMWYICTQHFGMRTGKECHDLCWGDIQLCLDEASGTEYLLYDRERQTKTRTGANPRDTRYRINPLN